MTRSVSSGVAIIGDVGGDSTSLEAALRSLGADPASGELPPDLNVIQVGDLVRVTAGGMDGSRACLATAMRFIRRYPDRWTQLVGNHELAFLGGPRRPSWPAPEDTGEKEVATGLRRMWHDGELHLAAVVSTAQGAALVTHAGLPLASWRWLGSPVDAAVVTEMLNRMRGVDPSSVAIGGALTGQAFEPSVDVTWPEVVFELYEPWIVAGDAPFDQIHGHASPWNWGTGAWWPGTSERVAKATVVDPVTHRTTCVLRSGRSLTSVDWGLSLGSLGGLSWPVLILDGIANR